ncbi:MAG: DUF4342 domain-containing protein [Clostridia bacterium]|nr:DUF4342 domain-containing protein [Clostridia bacterium]
MDHLEMVERLSSKANVSLEEAKEALEANDWDLLDALLMLQNKESLKDLELSAGTAAEEEQKTDTGTAEEAKASPANIVTRFLHTLAGLVKKGNEAAIEIKRKGELRLSLPLNVVLLLLIFLFWWTLAAAILALVFGYRFTIRGLPFDESVNNAMEKAGHFVDGVVKSVDSRRAGKETEIEDPKE